MNPAFLRAGAVSVLFVACLFSPSAAQDSSQTGVVAQRLVPKLSGGLQMGYALGQNGQGWPKPWVDPLTNLNRGGFYIDQVRLNAELPLDSSFAAFAKFNFIKLDVPEVYVRKEWKRWIFTAGKFRGAGLHSAVSQDEFEIPTVLKPFYSRNWQAQSRRFDSRDLGIQVETSHFGEKFKHRLFAHNANFQTFRGEEPSYYQGEATQVLGFDYAWDLQLPDSNAIGGHVGALADHEWDEFLGPHDFWEATYWFKANPLVSGSFYHELRGDSWQWTSEMLLRANRRLRNDVDSSASQAWGVMTQFSKRHSPRYQSVWRYEFYDPSDGYYPDDNLHLVTAGLNYWPSPFRLPQVKFLAEYVRVMEQDFVNTAGNDILYLQTQMTF